MGKPGKYSVISFQWLVGSWKSRIRGGMFYGFTDCLITDH